MAGRHKKHHFMTRWYFRGISDFGSRAGFQTQTCNPVAFRGLTFLSAILFIWFVTACGIPYGVYHTVEKGQTLYTISRVYDVPLKDIEKANGINDPSAIKPGEELFIPGAQKTMNVPPTAEQNNVQQPYPIQHEPVKHANMKSIYYNKNAHSIPGVFIWPVRGTVTQDFNTSNGDRHDGIDIKAQTGTPILAAAAGTVIYSNDTIKGYGDMVIIKHNDGFVTVYAHNAVNLVKQGQEVKQGEIIAKVGRTGYTTGPHLHFEIRLHAIPVDPLKYLSRQ